MAWPIDWTVNDQEWPAVTSVQAFQKAVNERAQALGLAAPITLKAVGDDVHDYAWIAELQQWVEDNLTSFVVSHFGGAPFAAGYYQGSASIYFYANLAAVFGATALATVTWRAYTTHPDDAGADQGRKIQAGDIIGPWHFEDLQAILNVMVCTAEICTWTHEEPEGNWRQGTDEGATAALAQAATETDWDGNAAGEVPWPPMALANVADMGANWQGRLDRVSKYMRGTFPNPCKRDIDWYVIGFPLDVWVANGDWPDGYAAESYSLLVTDAGVADATAESSITFGPHPIADGDKPSWDAGADDVSYGWQLDRGGPGDPNSTAVLRWDVTDGFEYQ